jgi:hypothetical protein
MAQAANAEAPSTRSPRTFRSAQVPQLAPVARAKTSTPQPTTTAEPTRQNSHYSGWTSSVALSESKDFEIGTAATLAAVPIRVPPKNVTEPSQGPLNPVECGQTLNGSTRIIEVPPFSVSRLTRLPQLTDVVVHVLVRMPPQNDDNMLAPLVAGVLLRGE